MLAGLTDSHIVSSKLQPDGRRWSATFEHPPTACAHGCATCKPAAMARLTVAGAVTVFVGDGMSDQYAAVRADVVFAKDKLAAFCDASSVLYRPYDTLATVAKGIDKLAGIRSPSRPSFSGKAVRIV